MNLRKARLEIRHWHEEFILQFHKDDHQFMHHLYMKYDHTQRVVNEVRGLSEAMNLSLEQSIVVELAALFHDLGRYVEFLGYQEYRAEERNHAKLSVLILEREEALKPLPQKLREQIYEIIYHHNSMDLSSEIRPDVVPLLSILRDADKIDIWRMIATFFVTPRKKRKEVLEINVPLGEAVKEVVLSNLNNKLRIPSELVENVTELKLQYLSWVYEVSSPWTYQVVHKRNYLHKIVETLPEHTRELFGVQEALKYLESQSKRAQDHGFRGR